MCEVWDKHQQDSPINGGEGKHASRHSDLRGHPLVGLPLLARNLLALSGGKSDEVGAKSGSPN